jgi:hypothetical protein
MKTIQEEVAQRQAPQGQPRKVGVHTVLTRLRSVRRNGAGFLARCPVHEDRSPSLSIRETDSKILLHCFTGCAIEMVCAAIDLKVSDLFFERGTLQQKPMIVREAEQRINDLRRRLTPRERVLPVTIVYCDQSNLDKGIARGLALAVEGDIVQCLLERES